MTSLTLQTDFPGRLCVSSKPRKLCHLDEHRCFCFFFFRKKVQLCRFTSQWVLCHLHPVSEVQYGSVVDRGGSLRASSWVDRARYLSDVVSQM